MESPLVAVIAGFVTVNEGLQRRARGLRCWLYVRVPWRGRMKDRHHEFGDRQDRVQRLLYHLVFGGKNEGN